MCVSVEFPRGTSCMRGCHMGVQYLDTASEPNQSTTKKICLAWYTPPCRHCRGARSMANDYDPSNHEYTQGHGGVDASCPASLRTSVEELVKVLPNHYCRLLSVGETHHAILNVRRYIGLLERLMILWSKTLLAILHQEHYTVVFR